MLENPRLRICVKLALLALIVTGANSARADEWRQYETPASLGWSAVELERARQTAIEAESAAVFVIEDGTVVAAWGEVDRPLPIYSMRKGLYNALVGILIKEGRIDPEATLQELGIDDIEGLTEQERSATVHDILASRSGVYHVSAYEPASMKRNRPDRGSDAPGETWFYNNWDFNLISHLIEKTSGQQLPRLFRDRLATPLGMEDLAENSIFSFYEPSRSRYPAVIFRMSARDLARVGVLFEQMGTWEGQELIDGDWIEESWKPWTRFAIPSSWEDATGFGYMWWIHDARADAERDFASHDVFLTRGSDGQVVAIIPALDLVVVHLTDTEVAEGGSFEGAARVIDAVIGAKTISNVEGSGPPRTISVRAVSLGGVHPATEPRSAVAWTSEEIRSLTGEYALNPQVSFLVHEVEGRLFALPKGVPLAEVEMFRDSSGTLFSPAVDVELSVVGAGDGGVIALEGQMEGRPVRMERVPVRPTSRKE